MSARADAVRKSLEGHLPSAADLTDDQVEILRKNLCTEPEALEDADIDTLAAEPDPVPKQLLNLIKGYKKRLSKRQKVAPDLSVAIVERLIGSAPASLPTVEGLKSCLLNIQQPLPVTQRVYEKLGLVAGGNELVRICTEQEDAEIVASFCCRIYEGIHTSGTEELTAYGVTKMIFDVLYQIDARIQPPLRVGLHFDKNASTKGTFSIPNTSSTRPDGTGVVKYMLLLAGEEKAEDGSIAQAKLDIKLKFGEAFSAMHYGLLDYIVVYAAAGKRVEFYAIKTRTAELIPILEEIDFSTAQGRAKLLLVVVNLYRLLLKMKEILPEEHVGLQMFKKKERPGRATVESRPSSIIKIVRGASEYFKVSGTSFRNVAAAYEAARATGYIVHAVDGPSLDTASDVYRVVVQPLGSAVKVVNELELKQLAHDLLHGLSYLHDKDICHRDIRPLNVVSYKDASSNVRHMLIDLESAAFSGAALPLVHFDAWEDETLVNGKYVPASDLYQCAKLLKETAKQAGIILSEQGREFMKELSSKNRIVSSLFSEDWLACKCGQGVAFSQ